MYVIIILSFVFLFFDLNLIKQYKMTSDGEKITLNVRILQKMEKCFVKVCNFNIKNIFSTKTTMIAAKLDQIMYIHNVYYTNLKVFIELLLLNRLSFIQNVVMFSLLV